MKAINPWYVSNNSYSKQFFEYSDKPLFSHRGVSVYYNNSGSYDYVIENTTIGQRAEFKNDAAPKIIDDMLDGIQPVSDNVFKHLKKIGFNPISYAEYTDLWRKGKRA